RRGHPGRDRWPDPASRRHLAWSRRSRSSPDLITDRPAACPAGLVCVESRSMIGKLRVEPGHEAGIAKRDPADMLGVADKDAGRKRLDELHARLGSLHDDLYAEGRHSVLLVLQGLDASGKDGVVRSVFTGINPQGCRVVSFKAPSSTE